MAQRAFVLARDQKPGAMRQAGQQARRLTEQFFRRPPRGVDLFLDGRTLFARQIANLQHAVDEQPQALLRRHPARAGMGRIEQPHLLQISHHIANGSRR